MMVNGNEIGVNPAMIGATKLPTFPAASAKVKPVVLMVVG